MTSLPSPSQLLKQAWQIFKSKAKTLILIQSVTVTFVLIIGIMQIVARQTNSPVPIILSLTLIIVAIIFQIWVQITMILAIDDPSPNASVGDLFARGRVYIGSYLWVSVLTGLIVFGGILLLIIPGIIFALWYSQSLYALILEGKKGMEALRTSKGYVKGNVWAVAWREAFIAFVSVLVMQVPLLLIRLVRFDVLKVPISSFESQSFEIPGVIYYLLSSLVFVPVVVIYAYLLYRSLRDSHAANVV